MTIKITIRGMIGLDDNATPEFLERELSRANGEDVLLEINSPGGFVFEGLEMANQVRRYPGGITARVVGMAASMASYIPMMADRFEVEDNTGFMIHNPAFFAFGNQHDMEKASNFLASLAETLGKAYVVKTGKSTAEIAALMDEETFLFGEEIVSEGFADAVVGETSEGDDAAKATAIATALEEIKACASLVDEAQKASPPDLRKIAAFLSAEPVQKHLNLPQEEKTMDLKEFLEANPEAKAEFDKQIKAAADAAETKGADTVRASMKAAMDVGLPIISSEHYPDKAKAEVSRMIQAGETEKIKTLVSVHDMLTEEVKGEQAEGEQEEETPAELPSDASDHETVLAEAVAYHNDNFRTGGNA
ncbi:MAG: head maturation protease, ClpP-related [Nitrospinaceae bacterium]